MNKFDRRQYERQNSLNLVEYIILGAKEEPVTRGIARTLNVSEAGLLLETQNPLEKGQRIQITVALEEEIAELKGEVIHVKPSEQKGFYSGIKILEINDAGRMVLEEYIEALKEDRPEPKNTSSDDGLEYFESLFWGAHKRDPDSGDSDNGSVAESRATSDDFRVKGGKKGKNLRAKAKRRGLVKRLVSKNRATSEKAWNNDKKTVEDGIQRSAERTNSRVASRSEKKHIRAQQKHKKGSNILKVAFSSLMFGILIGVFIGHLELLNFIESKMSLSAWKNEINQQFASKKPTEQPAKRISDTNNTKIAKKTFLIDRQVEKLPTKPSGPIKAKKNTDKREVIQKEGTVTYPYSIYLGSFRTFDRTQKAVSKYRKRGLSPYWIKIDLRDKGVWFRVFTGYFRTRRQAESFIRENKIAGATSKHTKYAIEIGHYKSVEEVKTKKQELSELGYSPYVLEGAAGESRLYTGAFYQKERAEKQRVELASMGIPCHVVTR